MTAKVFSALTVLVSAAVLTTAFLPAVAQESEKKQARAKWEYKLVKGALVEKALTELGQDGWELISITGGQPYIASSSTNVIAGTKNTMTTNTVQYAPIVHYFKRKK